MDFRGFWWVWVCLGSLFSSCSMKSSPPLCPVISFGKEALFRQETRSLWTFAKPNLIMMYGLATFIVKVCDQHVSKSG